MLHLVAVHVYVTFCSCIVMTTDNGTAY